MMQMNLARTDNLPIDQDEDCIYINTVYLCLLHVTQLHVEALVAQGHAREQQKISHAVLKAQIYGDKNWLIDAGFDSQLNFNPVPLTNETLREAAFVLASEYDSLIVDVDSRFRGASCKTNAMSALKEQLQLIIDMQKQGYLPGGSIPTKDLPDNLVEFVKEFINNQ
jgi:hypothetical protein